MRKYLFRLMMLAAIATASFTLFSCSSDDDDDNKPEENITTGNDDKADENVSEEENDNTNDTSTEEEISSQTGTHNGHGYVDLGLSVMWATCNVGANSPSDYGDYFAWGVTTANTGFTESSCATYGVIIGDIAGNANYDTARANWGGTWRMPNESEIDELVNQCTFEWTSVNGASGCKVIGPNGNSIFLPGMGYRYGSSLFGSSGTRGYYWSSTPKENSKESAYDLRIGSDDSYTLWSSHRCYGQSVRPVLGDATTETPSGDENSSLTGTINGHEYVDLGLSVKWATCNVGASSAVEYGNYYAWGEIATKSSYTRDNCTTSNVSLGDISGNANYDAARSNWGGTWRMPTMDEIDELRGCIWEWTTMDGVKGRKVTGPNGNSIFLPAAGCRTGTTLDDAGEYGDYWCSTPYESDTQSAYFLYFYSGGFYKNWVNRYYGRSVRPVSD
ncbi:MAG: DUF1566 domain-containing protein [Prevotellaceae bacterium]|nr:DUF1566 domain-containing protein [Prevotellaceae bacterium]